MRLLEVISIALIIFISGCTSQTSYTPTESPNETSQTQIQETAQTPVQPTEGTIQGEVLPPPQQQQTQPTTQEFAFETDDAGYYKDGQKVTSIPVVKGNTVKITFNLRTQGIYSGGAEYRGCGTQSPSAPPGGTTSMQFTASSTCTITAYWPSSGVAKASFQVVVS